MSYQQSFAISGAGMAVERMRVEVAALNLANANTVAGADGQLYKPLKVIAASPGLNGSVGGFSSLMNTQLTGPVAWIEVSESAPRRTLDPGHPMADAKGFVLQPNVNPASEMMTLMSALRSYEANVVAMNTVRSMVTKSLDIGGAS